MSEVKSSKESKLLKRAKNSGKEGNPRVNLETLGFMKKGSQENGKNRGRKVKGGSASNVFDEMPKKGMGVKVKVRNGNVGRGRRSSEGEFDRAPSRKIGGRNKRDQSRNGEADYVPFSDEKMRKGDNGGKRNVESNSKGRRKQGDHDSYKIASYVNEEINSANSVSKRKRVYADSDSDVERKFESKMMATGERHSLKGRQNMVNCSLVEEKRITRGVSNDLKQSSWNKTATLKRLSNKTEHTGEEVGKNLRGKGKNVDNVKVAEHGKSRNGREFAGKEDKDKRSSGDDSVVTLDRPKRTKRIGIRIDPNDITNKRIDDSIDQCHGTAQIGKSREKKEDSDTIENVEISKNAQFRSIQPTPAILSFVQENLLGRRREIEFKKAGYNIELPVPLDNIPLSTSSERERIEEAVFRNKLEFFAAAKVSSSLPSPDIPEIAFAGRSNVGKSSLLNALTRQWGVARTSDKPGLTQTINFFKLGSKFSLVDLPGYGFAYAKEEVKEAWEEFVKEYVSTRVGLKRVCLLIDTKWGMKPRDHELVELMESSKTKYQIVLTKTDLVFPIDVARRAMQIEEHLKANKSAVQPVMMVSSKTGAGIRSLRTVLGKIARFAKL